MVNGDGGIPIGGLVRRSGRWLCAVLALASYTASAVDARTLQGLGNARQYGSSDSSRPGLIRINILGGTASPGKYFVPPKTDLFEVLSLAGGVNHQADVTNLTVRRRTAIPESVFTVDVEELLRDAGSKPFYLEDNDVIIVNSKDPIISPEVASVVNFTASVLSITATIFLLRERIAN